jgi:hypothetical protein
LFSLPHLGVDLGMVNGAKSAVSATIPAVARTVAGCPKAEESRASGEDMKLNKALWEMAEVLRNSGPQ